MGAVHGGLVGADHEGLVGAVHGGLVGAVHRGSRFMTRVLALDYGSARCGCAVSDPTGTIVTPIEQIERPGTRRGMDAVLALIRNREIGRVVVGLPLSLSGEDTEQTREARDFAAALASRLGDAPPVELHDERYTTKIASSMRQASASEDSRAAAVLLEGWLAARSR